MVSHSQFFRSKTQDQNSSDTQDQNSLETQYHKIPKKLLQQKKGFPGWQTFFEKIRKEETYSGAT